MTSSTRIFWALRALVPNQSDRGRGKRLIIPANMGRVDLSNCRDGAHREQRTQNSEAEASLRGQIIWQKEKDRASTPGTDCSYETQLLH